VGGAGNDLETFGARFPAVFQMISA
jgi:hypothetical protein